MDESGLLYRRAEVIGRGLVDVRVQGDRVTEIGPALDGTGQRSIDCDGAALLPGLHDHHVHLLALVAARASVQCGPPEITDTAGLAAALAAAAPRDGWIRGVNYDESVAGELDGRLLDRIAPSTPTRVQHRSGALWAVNGAGAAALGLDTATGVEGIERDGAGRATGRLWRLDGWLRAQLGAAATPGLSGLGSELAGYGLTGVTDATPELAPEAQRLLISAQLPQRLVLLGADEALAGAELGPRKLVVADHDLPTFDDLVARIKSVRPRAVAVHCVSRVALVLALAAFDQMGVVAGDRIEHAAVAPPEAVRSIARLGLTVVTQPSLVARRGDAYLDRVEPDDQPHLWPFRSLLDDGVRVGCSSDAPYGDLSPWRSIEAAVRRAAPSGRIVGADQRVDAWTALRGYLTAPVDPGGPIRSVANSAVADLVLLDRPLKAALAEPADVQVRASVARGRLAFADLT